MNKMSKITLTKNLIESNIIQKWRTFFHLKIVRREKL